jgi:hypothetical protein
VVLDLARLQFTMTIYSNLIPFVRTCSPATFARTGIDSHNLRRTTVWSPASISRSSPSPTGQTTAPRDNPTLNADRLIPVLLCTYVHTVTA